MSTKTKAIDHLASYVLKQMGQHEVLLVTSYWPCGHSQHRAALAPAMPPVWAGVHGWLSGRSVGPSGGQESVL